MTDIVERLREHANALNMPKSYICWEAAAEIERLREFHEQATMTMAELRASLLHANDEIERLREHLRDQYQMGHHDGYHDALEEAAKVAEKMPYHTGWGVAAAIRALKEKP